MKQLKVPIWHKTKNIERLNLIRMLLSWGFNDIEISEKTGLHRITIGRYRKILKDEYDKRVYHEILEEDQQKEEL